jgi:phage-related minor tail protein
MTDAIGRATIDLEADASKLEAGMAKAGQAVEQFENAAVTSAGNAAKALGGVGQSVSDSGQKMDAATKRFISSLEREASQVGRTRSEYLALRAAKLGVSTAAEPLVGQIRAAEQTAATTKFIEALQRESEQVRLTRSEYLALQASKMGLSAQAAPFIARLRESEKATGNLGLSAKQTAAAMRLLPAQITDIVTSLASGHPAWLVAIQQGGQIKDSFGGVGQAFKQIASLFTPMRLAMFGIAGAAGVLATAFFKGQKESLTYAKNIELTGNAAGVTRDQLALMAESLDGIVGTQAAAAEALALFVGTGRVARGDLEKFTEVALRLDRVAGRAVADTVKQFAELGKDPVTASTRLNEEYNHLTLAVYDQIVALDRQGRSLEAASVAQNAFADAMAQRARNLESEVGTIEKAWKGVVGVAKEAWDAMLGIGRPATITDSLDEARRRIEALRQQQSGDVIQRPSSGLGPLGGAADASTRPPAPRSAALQSALDDQAALQELQRLQSRGAAVQAAIAAANRAAVQARQENKKWADAALTSTEKINLALKEYRDNNQRIRDAGGAISPETVRREEAAIREALKPKKGPEVRDDAATRMLQNLREQETVLQAQTIVEEKLTASEKARLEFIQQMADLKEKRILTADQKSLLANEAAIRSQLDRNVAVEGEVKAREAAAKKVKEIDDAREASLKRDLRSAAERAREEEELQRGNDALRDEIALLKGGKAAKRDYQAARVDSTIALKEDTIAQLQNHAGTEALIVDLRREIDLLKERSKLLRGTADEELAKEVREKNEKLAEDARKNTREALQGAFSGTITAAFKGEIDEVEDLWKNLLIDMVAQAASAQLTKALFSGANNSAGGSFADTILGFFGSFAGTFADGGTLGAGKWGIAGEAGPEIVKGPAQIVPMSQAGWQRQGGDTYVYSPQVQAGVTRGEVVSMLSLLRESVRGEMQLMFRKMVG